MVENQKTNSTITWLDLDPTQLEVMKDDPPCEYGAISKDGGQI